MQSACRIEYYKNEERTLRSILVQYADGMRTSTAYGSGRHVDTTDDDIREIEIRADWYAKLAERAASNLRDPQEAGQIVAA